MKTVQQKRRHKP